jgi:hypothetical protein
MLAGNPSNRAQPSTPQALSICHRCNGNGAGFAPCDSRDTSAFPTKICPGGIRASVIFPSCWDGKNLDSPDHSSHVAYSPSSTRSRGALAGADCPASHPVRVPQVMYEMQWDTAQFNKEEYFTNRKQPFVYSFGDRSGHGQHGDYLFGWKEGALQRGMDALQGEDCLNDRCHALKFQSVQEAVACTKKTQVDEVVGREGQCEFFQDLSSEGVANLRQGLRRFLGMCNFRRDERRIWIYGSLSLRWLNCCGMLHCCLNTRSVSPPLRFQCPAITLWLACWSSKSKSWSTWWWGLL